MLLRKSNVTVHLHHPHSTHSPAAPTQSGDVRVLARNHLDECIAGIGRMPQLRRQSTHRIEHLQATESNTVSLIALVLGRRIALTSVVR